MTHLSTFAAFLLLATPALATTPVPATIATCFTPAERCTPQIVSAIDGAQREIRVQAYGFTSAPILEALARAHTRGVDVAVIVDRSDVRSKRYTGALFIAYQGIPVWVDPAPGIAHNKVVVIDGHLVIGGSFNFTAAADTRNAENVTFVDSAEIAGRYLANWASRRDVAVRYEGE